MTEEPPQDILAERSTLGAMMSSLNVVAEVMGVVKATDFYRPVHETIFQVIIDLYAGGKPVDAVTVASELDSRGQLLRIGGAPYLLDLIQMVPTATAGATYARIVAERAVRRRLLSFGVRCQQLANTGADDEIDAVIAQAEQFLKEVNQPRQKVMMFSELVTEWNSWVESDVAADLIETPWVKVNDILSGGLYKGRLYVFAGRPGQGKSISALNVAEDACGRQGKSSLIFSLEMPKTEVMSRILCSGAEVSFQQVIRRNMRQETAIRIHDYYTDNLDMKLYIEDRPATVEQIAAQARAIKGLDMVIVDYVQLVKVTDKRTKRNEAIAHISRSLKLLAKELHVAVVLAAQMNRQSIDPKTGKARLPVLADLGESGALEADADAVLFLHRPEPEDGTVDIVVAKNRSGVTGSVPLMFIGQQARLG